MVLRRVELRRNPIYLGLLVFVWCAISVKSQQPEFALPGLPLSVDPSLQVAGSAVFVAAGSRLVRLDGELAQTDAVTLASDVLNIAASPDGQRLVACLSDSSCAVYNASDLNTAPLDVASGVHEAMDGGVTVFTVANRSYYVGSTRANTMGVQTQIVLGKLGGGSNQTREYEITRPQFVRNFTSGFLIGSNAYYVVYDTNPINFRNIRVMRVCDDGGFNALYEAALFCGAPVGLNSIVNEVSIVGNFVGSSGTTILLSHSRGGSNFVCLFDLPTIDATMDGRYNSCMPVSMGMGNPDDIEVAWDVNDLNLNCGTFTNNGVCNFSPPLDDAEDDQARISGNQLISTGTDILTASVGVVVESFSFVFTGFMRGGEPFIGAFDVTGVTGTLTPSAAFDSISMPSPVRQLRWEPGLEFVYAVTDTTVTRVPIADCAARSNCSSCLAYDNPLCGWCVVENKCSQRAECQNSDTRWKQSTEPTAECITFTITPENFILETPEILTVNVTPIVPVLLPNETYSCHLADAQMRFPPIVVPAVEVLPGTRTQYTCNITGEVASFGGSQAEIAFSFVSSMFGVPFDTNADALTIFDCPAATSCSECLRTRDACGWCNFNKVCSGTADPCVNTSSYLMLNGTGSFAEVCPLLRPGPQTGGNYNQPVGTATDLTLTTSNLPPPFGDFSYGCRINNVNLPAMYSNESAITCVIDMGNLPLMSSNGQEDVEVTIRWMGPNQLDHPIGAFDPATRVVLYDCPVLGGTCSTCLSAIMPSGFECGWCMDTTNCLFVGVTCSSTHVLDGSGCQAPIIQTFSPASGPTEGGTTITIEGTDLGVTFQDFAAAGSISIGMPAVPCTPIAGSYQPGSLVQCETTSGVMTGQIQVDLGAPRIGSSTQQFAVVAPAITAVEPDFGPLAGGSRVRVQGSNLDAGNQGDTRVTFNAVNPLDCTVMGISESEINCTTSLFNGSVSSDEMVFVRIDNADVSTVGVVFTYRSNPTFTSLLTANTIPAGGITLSFAGENFDVISNPVIQITDPRYATTELGECVAVTPMLLNCTAPALLGNGPNTAENITYTVIVDNAPGPMNIPLALLPDPSNFRLATPEQAIGAEAIISITGDGLENVDISEYRVTVAGQPCVIQSLIFCRPPADPLQGPGLAEVVVFVGDSIEVILDDQLEYTEAQAVPLQIIIPCVVGGLVLVVLLSLCLICCIACCYNSRARKKEKQWTNLLAQMELMEMEMAEECKRAFTELQTDLADLVQISSDKNLPYRDFRSFAMRFLFPQGGENHPVLMPLQLPEKSEKNNVMQDLETFRQLLMNKTFLLVFVRTLEGQGYRFTLQDKCTVASLLMVAFQNDLDYATEILQTLLAELMRKTVTKNHPKLLLRRTESVAEKMLANWLAFLLYPYLLEHVGEPLFILYRAIKSQLEKGPVDVVSGDARHCLSEEKLLRQHLDVKSIEGVVETESGEEIAIKLLDCDSVTQAKEKILDALYKNTPVSKRPQLTDIDLELCRGTAGIPLRDQDATNLKEGDWIKINTLGHYKLDEMSQAHIDNPKNPVPKFRVVRRSERPLSGMSFDTIGTIITNANANRTSVASLGELPHIFHLVKPELDEGEGQQKIVSEVFLTRLLSTKRILQPYVDALFQSVFAVPHGRTLPKAVKSLFDFLDLQAAELGIQDPEILHTWKTNSVPLRFWVNVIKNPDFVFDINKSATVDACLTVIAQAYIDACSTAELKYTKETPSARLLYVNEVKSYKNAVSQYYGQIQSLPKLSPHEMGEYLRETAQVCATSITLPDNDTGPAAMTRQLYFVTESALYELFKFAAQYSDELVDSLNEEGHSSLAGKFEHLTKSIST